MKTYIGTKIIKAEPMSKAEFNHYMNYCNAEYVEREGYLVEYSLTSEKDKPNHPDHEGYVSWSPKESFEEAYEEMTTTEPEYHLKKSGHKKRLYCIVSDNDGHQYSCPKDKEEDFYKKLGQDPESVEMLAYLEKIEGDFEFYLP